MLAHPVSGWLISTGTVIAWHIPALFEMAMESAEWHVAESACFLVAGILFWWPVIRPWPRLAAGPLWSIPLYLFLATLPCDALSAFLTFCNAVVYPHYLSAHRAFRVSALADQEFAGAMMWVWVTLAYLAPAAAATIRMLSPRTPACTANAG
jgi:putative membrane protein